MTLPPRRLLNAMYSYWVGGLTPETRALVDDALSDTTATAPTPRRAAGPSRHVAGLAPPNIPAPSWWRGDRAAFATSVAAGQQLGEPAAMRERPRQGLPMVGTQQVGVG